jgi:hypothetical protein
MNWISVKDKLPPKGFYLTCVDTLVASKTRGRIEIGECFDSVDIIAWKPTVKFHDYVTHWMPLPEPPKVTE